MADSENNGTYHIKKDGQVVFTGTANECFGKLLRIQPFSTYYATRYGGYKIEPQKRKGDSLINGNHREA